jgi:hypothetical protein
MSALESSGVGAQLRARSKPVGNWISKSNSAFAVYYSLRSIAMVFDAQSITSTLAATRPLISPASVAARGSASHMFWLTSCGNGVSDAYSVRATRMAGVPS